MTFDPEYREQIRREAREGRMPVVLHKTPDIEFSRGDVLDLLAEDEMLEIATRSLKVIRDDGGGLSYYANSTLMAMNFVKRRKR
jgi:hypothetical protein